MNWSLRLGRIAGTDVKIHLTFFVLLAFYAFEGYRAGGLPAAVESAGFLLALFACVLLHEFGHILMARRFGVRTPDVILLPIGGLARLERIPEEPRQELLIALAGPVVTLAIALTLYLVLRLGGDPVNLLGGLDQRGPFLDQLMAVNAGLLVFNLIPAFPMDGGRVLRAILASRLGLPRATRIAATIGQGLAVLLGIVGLAGSPVLVLIALFVFLGAGAEAAAVEARTAGRGLKAEAMMITQFHAIPIHARLQQAVDLLLAGDQREFPVVDNLGRVEGLLTRENLIRGLAERGPQSTVGEAMTAGVPVLQPDVGFDTALERLRASGLPALPVVDAGGGLVGLLSLDNISELLLVRRAVTKR